ncbi:MAG TPA: hypothetical protein VGJ13_16005 [Pseudonocardiaceae bacterium]
MTDQDDAARDLVKQAHAGSEVRTRDPSTLKLNLPVPYNQDLSRVLRRLNRRAQRG